MSAFRFAQLVLFIVVMTGCGSGTDDSKAGRLDTVPAEGIVTYRGEPLETAMIILQPSDNHGIAASAVTNAEGKFVLKSYPPDAGTVPGTYTVSIIKTDFDDPKFNTKPVDNDSPEYLKSSTDPVPVSLIPIRYNDPSTSRLSAEIPPEGTTELLFELEE